MPVWSKEMEAEELRNRNKERLKRRKKQQTGKNYLKKREVFLR